MLLFGPYFLIRWFVGAQEFSAVLLERSIQDGLPEFLHKSKNKPKIMYAAQSQC